MTAPTHVLGFGVRSCVGLNAASTAAAVRAGLTGFFAHPRARTLCGETMTIAADPSLDDPRAVERLIALAKHALDEVLDETALDGSPVPLYLALPGPRRGLPRDYDGRVLRALGPRVRLEQVSMRGSTSGLLVLRALLDARSEAPAFALLGGVDTQLDPSRLDELAVRDLALGERNGRGRVPGEAAGFCLLCNDAGLRVLDRPPLASIVAVAQSWYRRSKAAGPNGLARVFGELLTDHPERDVSDIYCDLGAERERADEYAHAVLEVRPRLRDPSALVHGSRSWGDIGAASVPLLLNLAVAAAVEGYAAGELAMIWCGSESGERAAALVRVKAGRSWA